MYSTCSPRIVVRRNAPPFTLRKHTYAKAMPYLLKDFDNRCAYSLQHTTRCALAVDHFDPRKKRKAIQQYGNLYPASSHCNRAKSATWPTLAMVRAGIELLDCCKSPDYGAVIFEDSASHELVGSTPAARFHIEVCALNATHLVSERRKRAQHWHTLENTPVLVNDGELARVMEIVHALRSELELMIPRIAPPPSVGHNAGQ